MCIQTNQDLLLEFRGAVNISKHGLLHCSTVAPMPSKLCQLTMLLHAALGKASLVQSIDYIRSVG